MIFSWATVCQVVPVSGRLLEICPKPLKIFGLFPGRKSSVISWYLFGFAMDPFNRHSSSSSYSPFRAQWPPSSFSSSSYTTPANSVFRLPPSARSSISSTYSTSPSYLNSRKTGFTSPSPRRRRFEDPFTLSDSSSSSSGPSYPSALSPFRRSRKDKQDSTLSSSRFTSPPVVPTSATSKPIGTSGVSKLSRRIDSFLRTSEQTIDRVNRSRQGSRGPSGEPSFNGNHDGDISLSLSGRAFKSPSAVSIAIKADKQLAAMKNGNHKKGCDTSESLDNLDSDSDEDLCDISDDTSADLSKVGWLVLCIIKSEYLWIKVIE